LDGTDVSFALRSNYWCAFLSASLRVLTHKGNLAFVLPAAWDYALYATDVRRTILQQFESVEVHRCQEPLFTQVRDGCVVLVAKGFRGNPTISARIDHVTSQALIAALVAGAAPKPQIHHLHDAVNTSLTALSDLYAVHIGCVTGDARYFLLRESDRMRLELPIEAVRPVLSKACHLATAYITSAAWKRLLKADERVWLFSPGPEVLRRKAVRAYLEHGEQVCDLKGYKLRHRDPWYWVPDVKDNALGFLSGMTKLGPWISFRRKRHLAASNTLYTLTPKNKMRIEEHAAWALALLSTPARLQYQEIARRYPDGLAKLEPHDVNSLCLPSPSRVKGALEAYERAVNQLVSGNVAGAVAVADAFVGRPCA
jgi:hypothetical protein